MFDIVISELENIRRSFFKKWIILSILIGILTFVFLFFPFSLEFSRREFFERILSIFSFIFLFALFSGSFSIYFLYKMSKEFSFIVKEKIFGFVKRLGDNIEIINYQKKSEDLKNIVKKIYKDFNLWSILYKYNQEHNFTIRIDGKDIKICQIELADLRGEVTVSQCVVISIPTKYVKNGIKEYKMVKEEDYTHIFIPLFERSIRNAFIYKPKDVFRLSILKPIKQEDIENIMKELKDYVNMALKFIKEEDDS